MRIPYVIDNQSHRMADVLNALLAEHKGRSQDVATAYFTIQGFRLLQADLDGLCQESVGALVASRFCPMPRGKAGSRRGPLTARWPGCKFRRL